MTYLLLWFLTLTPSHAEQGTSVDCTTARACRDQGRCTLFEYEGNQICVRNIREARAETSRGECEAVGGKWLTGPAGRGHLIGCNLPTTDAGQKCATAKECEGPCVNGACHSWTKYKGCGVTEGLKTLCFD